MVFSSLLDPNPCGLCRGVSEWGWGGVGWGGGIEFFQGFGGIFKNAAVFWKWPKWHKTIKIQPSEKRQKKAEKDKIKYSRPKMAKMDEDDRRKKTGIQKNMYNCPKVAKMAKNNKNTAPPKWPQRVMLQHHTHIRTQEKFFVTGAWDPAHFSAFAKCSDSVADTWFATWCLFPIATCNCIPKNS